jgi:K(+)-stimulated pyrophosphate-energized sodium pump
MQSPALGISRWIHRALSGASTLAAIGYASAAHASEADLVLPDLSTFQVFGTDGRTLLMVAGFAVCVFGLLFGFMQYSKLQKLPVHQSMKDVSELIYETCKTYLFQQGKFIMLLWVFIGAIMVYYFGVLSHMTADRVLIIVLWSLVGIAGSYGVAWFGIRVNTFANSRTAFASLRGKPFPTYAIPLQAGMSIGMLLISVELFLMLIILLFVSAENAGACFIGFAIGESLGASALRIAGGIFTKIADIGSDLMKIVFNIKEDDARNPGVIADCTGDNAGDSVGPSADGFETYGVTGVALISFILLAVREPAVQVQLLVWIFVMRLVMVIASVVSYYVNDIIAKGRYGTADKMNFEQPLTQLVWLTSIISVAATYGISYLMIPTLGDGTLWWKLSTIITCGTLAGAIIPEVVKVFTSTESKHVREVVTASREGGASLNVLSGLTAGNFSGLLAGPGDHGPDGSRVLRVAVHPRGDPMNVTAGGIMLAPGVRLRPGGLRLPRHGPGDHRRRLLRPGDRQRPVGLRALADRDHPQHQRRGPEELRLRAQLREGKHYLEENDGAGNTFKATAKPVFIGTAVVGATTMIFSIIMVLTDADHQHEPAVDHARAVYARPHRRRRGHLLVHRAPPPRPCPPALIAPWSSSRATSSSTAAPPRPPSRTPRRSSRSARSTRRRACSTSS